ncbi:MAG TPA: hypothetical protein VF829_02135 [Candidatus Paceibacterota bacterium]
MENRYVLLLVVFGLIITASLLLYYNTYRTLRTTNVPSISAPVATSTWSTYLNSAYHYAIRYPSDWSVHKVLEEDRAGDTESSFVEAFGPEGLGPVVVRVVKARPSPPQSEQQQVFSYTSKEIAEYGRQAEIEYLSHNPTSYNTHLHPSEIISRTIGGKTAYGFSINGYSEAWPLGGFEGPSLNVTNNYFVFQNDAGDKFIIAYPADDPVAQEIVNSFQFTNATTSTGRN